MKILIVCLIGLFPCSAVIGQTLDDKYQKDVESIGAIIDAYYDVISGSSEDPWQFERDKFLHSANAVIIRLDDEGDATFHSLEAEYIPMGLHPREDLYEIELKREVRQFGNIAQVWSAFEIREDPEVPTNIRGLNSIQLHYENGRWYIDSWTVQMESTDNLLVEEFLDHQ
ncbi:hypothetical protein [Pararhodonellum marinum]|uniref:hypothetical protein n=1 Tax=Pararhodonellum marinum TaxID=2755358 RepID=UPI00188E862C|nr:hypothetical protein [Pararhodonellum marinum]